MDGRRDKALSCVSATKIVAKASDGQRYPLPLCEYMWMSDGERGSGPEGADDLCCFYLSLKAGIRAWRLALGP